DAAARAQLARVGQRVEAEPAHAARVGGAQALAALDRRGLARAVGPEHGGDRAALGGEAHAVDDGTTVVALDEVVHEHGRGGHPAILGGGRAPPGPRTAAATRVSRTPHRAPSEGRLACAGAIREQPGCLYR